MRGGSCDATRIVGVVNGRKSPTTWSERGRHRGARHVHDAAHSRGPPCPAFGGAPVASRRRYGLTWRRFRRYSQHAARQRSQTRIIRHKKRHHAGSGRGAVHRP